LQRNSWSQTFPSFLQIKQTTAPELFKQSKTKQTQKHKREKMSNRNHSGFPLVMAASSSGAGYYHPTQLAAAPGSASQAQFYGQQLLAGLSDSALGSMFDGSKLSMKPMVPSVPKPPAIHQSLNISLADYYNGAARKMRITRDALCSECHGRRTLENTDFSCEPCGGTGNIETPVGINSTMSTPYTRKTRCEQCLGSGVKIPEDKKCWSCLGVGLISEAVVVTVDIEPCGDLNAPILLLGQGHQVLPDAAGTQTGDISVKLVLAADSHYVRVGTRLYFEKQIDIFDAVLGVAFEHEFIDGRRFVFRCTDVVRDGQLFVASVSALAAQTEEETADRQADGDNGGRDDSSDSSSSAATEDKKAPQTASATAPDYVFIRLCFRYPVELLASPERESYFVSREKTSLLFSDNLCGQADGRIISVLVTPTKQQANYFDMNFPQQQQLKNKVQSF
jgi:hypothetical protein